MSDLNVKELTETLEQVGLKVAVIDEDTEFVDEVPSPFLPDTNIQFAWDATSLEYYKRCPRLYKYLMIDGYRKKDENVHLRFGSEFHTAAHQFELLKAEGLEHEEVVFHVVKELLLRTDDFNPDRETKAGNYKNRVMLLRAVITYMDKYKNDPAVTLKLNGKPAVEVSFRFELEYGPIPSQPYILCGHLDRVVEFASETFIIDYKTTTSTPTAYYWAQFNPHNQMSLYTLAGSIIFQSNVKGVMVESAQLMIEESPRFTRGMTYRTREQSEEWLSGLEHWLNRAHESAKNNDWPMNDTACDKYGGCPFRDKVCSKSPNVRQRYLDSEFVKGEPWNPLAVR